MNGGSVDNKLALSARNNLKRDLDGENRSFLKLPRLRKHSSRWENIRETIKHLFSGCNQRNRCSPLRVCYWREVFPVKIGEMAVHLYPNLELEKDWAKIQEKISYTNFVKTKFLDKSIDFSENNVIYFNQEELESVKPSFQEGLLKNKGKNFKCRRYIFVLTKANDLLITQKYKSPMGRIQHSSLTKGCPVKSAGWLTFNETGRLTEISNFSGHYFIDKDQLNRAIRYLKDKGVNLDLLRVVFSSKGTASQYSSYTLDQWNEYYTKETHTEETSKFGF